MATKRRSDAGCMVLLGLGVAALFGITVLIKVVATAIGSGVDAITPAPGSIQDLDGWYALYAAALTLVFALLVSPELRLDRLVAAVVGVAFLVVPYYLLSKNMTAYSLDCGSWRSPGDGAIFAACNGPLDNAFRWAFGIGVAGVAGPCVYVGWTEYKKRKTPSS